MCLSKASNSDELIICSFILAEPKVFRFLRREIKRQLIMMPENEKYHLKQELQESRDKKERIKELGIDLLDRNFIH